MFPLLVRRFQGRRVSDFVVREVLRAEARVLLRQRAFRAVRMPYDSVEIDVNLNILYARGFSARTREFYFDIVNFWSV